jgi:hypothetical protein
MAEPTSRAGRLIAVDGSRGKAVAIEAEALAAALRARGVACGISRWDASGVFGDFLLAEPDELVVSPRTLALLYAADLAFRLRWEIRPALAEGHIVIAAPYLDTATAIGVGLGLPDAWVRDVLRFADAADYAVRTRERKRGQGWKTGAARGYGEYCAALLAASPAGLARRKARIRSVQWLEAKPVPRPVRLTKKALAALVARRQPAEGAP